MKTARPSATTINNLYMRIRAARPSWFMASCDIAEDDYDAFCGWVYDHLSWWYDDGTNIVLCGRRAHVLEAHPLFLGPVNVGFLEQVLAHMASCDVHRVEVPLIYQCGHTVRRVLRQLGFLQEGIMRGKERVRNFQTGGYTYLDVELWSKLLMRS